MARGSMTRRVTQRFYLTHRGGGAGSDLPTGCYVASAFGGPADLQLVLTGGKITTVAAKPNRAWDDFDYTLGTFTAGGGGYGWDAAWTLVPSYLRVVATDSFAAYSEGPFAGNGGSGWSNDWTAATPYPRLIATDSFETYADGAFAGSGGSGWNGGFVVASY